MDKLPKAKKHFGQHFLKDQNIITKITQDYCQQADVIVEVGPGPGILTQKLAETDCPFYVIEKDPEMEQYLAPLLVANHIFIADALEFDWSEFILQNNLADKKIWLVSNLPYNVGTILFTQFLQIPQIQFMTLMFQKEVGDKTYPRAEKNQMSGLLVLSQNYFNSSRLIKVAPGAFNPPPKVDSVVVSFERKTRPHIPLNNFEKLNQFCRQLFGQRRKQIRTVLKQFYPVDKIDQTLNELGITPNTRAEALLLEQVENLFLQLNS